LNPRTDRRASRRLPTGKCAVSMPWPRVAPPPPLRDPLDLACGGVVEAAPEVRLREAPGGRRMRSEDGSD